MIQLIVGLANPGPEYAQTRHNAGAWFIERLLGNRSLETQAKLFAQVTQLPIAGKSCRLMIPTTYMNESGKAVAAVARFFKIPVESILVVHDELDLPVGTVRLKTGGGHGGHNGLRHLIQSLGSPHFHRLRVGIGRPTVGEVVDYVLKRPSNSDYELIAASLARAEAVIPWVIEGEMQKAMTELHTG